MNHLRIALACLVACSALAGQVNPDPGTDASNEHVLARIHRLAASDRPVDRAWAATLAGKHRLTNAMPAVVRLLERPLPEKPTAEAFLVRRAALDALVRLRQHVPPDVLLALPARFRDTVLVLLAQFPKENQGALLGLIQNPTTRTHWVAVCNLLAPLKTPGLAALLLWALEFEITVVVHDGGLPGGASASFRGGRSHGRFHVPRGFPPIARYIVTASPRPGHVVLAAGPPVVYYDRRVVEPGTTVGIGSTMPSYRDEHDLKLTYLARMLDARVDTLSLKTNVRKHVRWESPDRLLVDAGNIRARTHRAFHRLVDRLRQQGHLTPTEANAVPRNIIFRIEDQRGDKSTPLPSLAPAPSQRPRQREVL